MRPLVIAALLLLPLYAVAQDSGRADLFSRMDQNGDGYLSDAEMHSDAAAGNSWIAVDRDQDGRVSRAEFTSMNHAQVTAQQAEQLAALRGGYSARRLLGTEARRFDGEPIGEVRDILVDSRGRVAALAVDAGGGRQMRVPWREARIADGVGYVSVPVPGASAGATRAAPQSYAWRMTGLLDDEVHTRRGTRYGDVSDLIIDRAGNVTGYVVDADAPGLRGRYAYPWRRDRFDPVRGIHSLPYAHTHVQPFDYGALGIAGPR